MPETTAIVLDKLSRPVKDLRISLTDRCQFRCEYCLPAEHADVMRNMSKPENHLSFSEIITAVQAFAQLGVEKIRLTGGEPLLRKNVPHLVRKIKAIDGIKEVALTTNAGLLKPILSELIEAGLDRITISLDAMEQKLFAKITGTQFHVKDILNNIDDCVRAINYSSLQQVKVNCVIQTGVNEDQIIPMLAHFRNSGVVVRFIEFMDVGNINGWQRNQVLESKQILQLIDDQWPVEPKSAAHIGEVADRFEFSDGGGEFGLISSISEPFCHDCNRARLSTQGEVYTCLFANQGHNIRELMQQPEQLHQKLTKIWHQRSDQYSMDRAKILNSNSKTKHLPKVEMFVIGG